jgi:hypothetical protein
MARKVVDKRWVGERIWLQLSEDEDNANIIKFGRVMVRRVGQCDCSYKRHEQQLEKRSGEIIKCICARGSSNRTISASRKA